jgi:hypothetical protein
VRSERRASSETGLRGSGTGGLVSAGVVVGWLLGLGAVAGLRADCAVAGAAGASRRIQV